MLLLDICAPSKALTAVEVERLSRAHLKHTINEALHATARALLEAENCGLNHVPTDSLRIAYSRLEGAQKGV